MLKDANYSELSPERMQELKRGLLNNYAVSLSSVLTPPEREKVGFWYGLWLKMTFRKPDPVYIKRWKMQMKGCEGKTITFRRHSPFESGE